MKIIHHHKAEERKALEEELERKKTHVPLAWGPFGHGPAVDVPKRLSFLGKSWRMVVGKRKTKKDAIEGIKKAVKGDWKYETSARLFSWVKGSEGPFVIGKTGSLWFAYCQE